MPQQTGLYDQIEAMLSQIQMGDIASDHISEINGYQGWNYVAISAVQKQAARSLVYVYDDKEDPSVKEVRKQMRLEKGWNYLKSYTREHQGKVVDSSHSLVELLHRPNPGQSGASFRSEQIMQMRLHGSSLVWNRPNKIRTRTVERYNIPMALAEPIPPGYRKAFPRGGVRIRPTSYMSSLGIASSVADGFAPIHRFANVEVPVEDLSIVRYPHPYFRGDGMSPTTAIGKWIDTGTGIDDVRLQFYMHGPNGQIIVQAEEEDPKKIADVERVLNEKFGPNGPQVVVIGNGKSIASHRTAEELGFEESHNQLKSSILAGQHLSRASVGDQDSMTYGALAASLLATTVLSVQPDMDMIADEDTLDLCSEEAYSDQVLSVEYEVPSIDDPELEERRIDTDARHSALTMREYRRRRGMPEFGDERDDMMITPQGPVKLEEFLEGGSGGGGGFSPWQFSKRKSEITKSASKSPVVKSDMAMNTLGEFRPLIAMEVDGTICDPANTGIGPISSSAIEAIEVLKSCGCDIAAITSMDPDEIGNHLRSHGLDVDVNVPRDSIIWDRVSDGVDGENRLQDLKGLIDRLPDCKAKRELAKLLGGNNSAKEYGVVMLKPSEQIAEAVRSLASKIDPGHIAEGGVEDDPHVTLLYGIVDSDAEDVSKTVRGMGAPEIEFLNIGHFADRGQGAPLVLNVESSKLHDMNRKLKRMYPHIETFPDYKPHMTIAYVKPEFVDRYTGPSQLQGALTDLDSAEVRLVGQDPVTVPLKSRLSVPEEVGETEVMNEDLGTDPLFSRSDAYAEAAREQESQDVVHELTQRMESLFEKAFKSSRKKSISAIVEDVVPSGNEVVLKLSGEERGQEQLTILNPNGNMQWLKGEHIWGGDGDILIGEERIAERIGYTSIRMLKSFQSPLTPQSTEVFRVAGLAVMAKDTGRLLMLKRASEPGDPAGGRWEFPGGHCEADQRPIDAAIREWQEEVGVKVPKGELKTHWDDKFYRGHIWLIDSEGMLDTSKRSVSNPDGHDEPTEWVTVDEILHKLDLRQELRNALPRFLSALAEVKIHDGEYRKPTKEAVAENGHPDIALRKPHEVDEKFQRERREAMQPGNGDTGGWYAGRTVPESNLTEELRRRDEKKRFVSQLIKAGFKSDQPRDDKGQWVGVGDIVEASKDPARVAELFSRVTKPAERSKLEQAIKTAIDERERGREPVAWESVGNSHNIEFAVPPTVDEVYGALASSKREYIGKHREVPEGSPVGLRIDIPAFTRHGIYVVTVHEKAKSTVGRRIGYDAVARVSDAKFFSREDGAADIMLGRMRKFPTATVEGNIVHDYSIPEDLDSWTPVGYNPKKAVFFYDKRTGREVVAGDEALSVGNTVFVRTPEFGDRDAVNSHDEVRSVGKRKKTRSREAALTKAMNPDSELEEMVERLVQLRDEDPFGFKETFGYDWVDIKELARHEISRLRDMYPVPELLKKRFFGDIVDHDGDGLILDGTKYERAAPVRTPEEVMLGRRGPGKINVLGAMLHSRIEAGEPVSLLGKKVTSASDLAGVAQVYRDTRYETMRVVFVKDGEVVGQNAYSSRMPSVVAFPEHFWDEIDIDLRHTGADKLYFLHNHPSGDPTPSAQDMGVTKKAGEVWGNIFGGHVIVNHEQSAIIDGSARFRGDYRTESIENEDLNNPENAEIPHELIGQRIGSTEALSQAALKAGAKPDRITMIFTSAKSKVRALVDIDKASAMQEDHRVFGALRRMSRATGSGGHRFAVLGEGLDVNDYAFLVEKGFMTDIVSHDGISLRSQASLTPGKDRAGFNEGALVFEERAEL